MEELTIQGVILESLEGEEFDGAEESRREAKAEIAKIKRELKSRRNTAETRLEGGMSSRVPLLGFCVLLRLCRLQMQCVHLASIFTLSSLISSPDVHADENVPSLTAAARIQSQNHPLPAGGFTAITVVRVVVTHAGCITR